MKRPRRLIERRLRDKFAGEPEVLFVTPHARKRIRERNLDPADIYRAFEGRRVPWASGRELRYDRHSRTALVIQRWSNTVLTTYRLTRRQAKRLRKSAG